MVKMVLWWVVEQSSCQNMYGIKSIGGSQPSVKLNQLFPSKFSRTTTTTRPYHLISALETLHSMSCSKVASFGEGFLIFEAMYHPSHQQDLQSIVFENHFEKSDFTTFMNRSPSKTVSSIHINIASMNVKMTVLCSLVPISIQECLWH